MSLTNIEMERLVERGTNNLIFRLPQVVGRTENPNTLANYLNTKIKQREPFEIWLKARRRLIDVEDVVRIVRALIANSNAPRTINVAPPQDHSMLEIVGFLETILGMPAFYTVLDKGNAYSFDTMTAAVSAANIGLVFGENYAFELLKKYYAP